MKPNSSTVPLKNSIATRLLKVVFSIYVLISIGLTGFHMFTEYLNTKKEVRHELEALYKITRQGLTNAFFDADLFQVKDILEGMATSPSVLGAKLVDSMGHTVEESGKIFKSGPVFQHDDADAPGYHEDKAAGLFVYNFPLIHSNDMQEIRMGTLSIYSGSSVIFQKVKYGFFLIIINAVIKTVALWIIFLYFSRAMVGRPLGALTTAVEKLDFDNPESFEVDVGTRGRNELKVLEEAFNKMAHKLHKAHSQLREYANELDRSHRKLHDIVNASPAVIYAKDTSGRYELVNWKFERLFNLRRDQVLGKTDSEIFPEETEALLAAGDQQVTAENKLFRTEVAVSGDDELQTYLLIKFALHDAGNSVYGIAGIATDISDRIKAQKISREASRRIFEVQEQERKAVAQEVHDSLGARLAAVMFGLERTQGRLRGHGLEEETEKILAKSIGMLKSTIEEARRISRDLWPSILKDLGLRAAVRSLLREFAMLHGTLEVEHELDDRVDEIPENLNIVNYRVLQEALNNAAAHAEAERVLVRIKLDEMGVLRLSVADNGKGMDVEKALTGIPKRSLGLSSMRERVETSGGRWEIRSEPGMGTEILAEWNLGAEIRETGHG